MSGLAFVPVPSLMDYPAPAARLHLRRVAAFAVLLVMMLAATSIPPSVYAGEPGSGTDALTMSSTGRDYYREFQVSLRYRLGGTGHITASYVRSSSSGEAAVP